METASSGRFRVGISGSYGGLNLGDEAILEGILGQLRATVPADVTVFSRVPSHTLATHDVQRAIAPRSLTRRMATSARITSTSSAPSLPACERRTDPFVQS
jgi:polysaccharide pyruvyl transferase WcaK-like protein